jgi:hypothetical protein
VLSAGPSDRALQDALIRLLADAPFREAVAAATAGVELAGLAPEHLAALRSAQPERVRRFARFLARRYYFERIAHFHRYSHALARWTHRWPHEVLRSSGFEALLPTVVLGSRETAVEVAALLEAHLAAAPGAPPYAADLVRYENAQLVAESGPRTWRSGASSPSLTSASILTVNPRTTILELEWDLPQLLPRLRAFGAAAHVPTTPPEGVRRPVTLLVARSPRGRVTVLHAAPRLLAFLHALDGARPIALAARHAGLPADEALPLAVQLHALGALELLASAEPR